MVFVGSADSADELVEKLVGHRAALMGAEDFQRFLAETYPRCDEYYKRRRERGKTTWSMEPVAQMGLFAVVEKAPGWMDYVFCQIDPKPNQVITLAEVKEGVKSLEGKSIVDMITWSGNEGLEKKYEVYER